MNDSMKVPPRTAAVGVVLPVHNEEDLLGDCLEALAEAAARLVALGVPCRTVIVLDHCVDASAQIARKWVRQLRRQGGRHRALMRRRTEAGVGNARRTGSSALLREWTGTAPRQIWLATTDADSRVPNDWLTVQLAAHEGGADIWSGRVSVEDWSLYHPDTERQWNEAYENEPGPIHGASLGFNAQAYLDSGGFAALHTGEDRALHGAIVGRGGRAFEDNDVRVITSSRRQARAPRGFAAVLTTLDDGLEIMV